MVVRRPFPFLRDVVHDARQVPVHTSQHAVLADPDQPPQQPAVHIGLLHPREATIVESLHVEC